MTKFEVSKNALLNGLRWICQAKKNRTYPITGYVKMSVKKDCIELISTNLDINLHRTIPIVAGAQIGVVTEVTLPKQSLRSFVQRLDEEFISFEFDTDVVISAGGCSLQLSAAEAFQVNDFPSLFVLEAQVFSEEFDIAALREQSQNVVHVVAQKKDGRPPLASVCWELTAKNSRMIATDGHRLVYVDAPLSKSLKVRKRRDFLVDPRVFEWLPKEGGICQVKVSETKIAIEGDSWSILVRLIEGPYPEYRKVVKKVFDNIETEIELSEDSLYMALDRLQIFTTKVLDRVYGRIEEDKLYLTARDLIEIRCTETVSGKSVGSPLELAWRASYMKDALIFLGAETTVKLSYTGELAGMMVRNPDDENRVYLLMPILSE